MAIPQINESDSKSANVRTDPTSEIQTVSLFYSYCHADEDIRNQLENHLAILKRQELISSWHDRRILAGDEWENQIDAKLNSADVILLLVSADFIASNYCFGVELLRAMERHEKGEACVVPIILRPVDWQTACFGKLQALPTDGKPITSWENRDEAFAGVAKGIREIVEGLTKRRRTSEWRLKIEGTLSDFDQERLDEVLERLRELTGDLCLRIEAVKPGSVILVVNGTEAAFSKLAAMYIDGLLTEELLGFQVEDIYKKPKALEALTSALEHPNNSVRSLAIDELAGMGQNARNAVPKLLELIPNSTLGPDALQALRRIGPAPDWCLSQLFDFLCHDEPMVRIAAIHALGNPGNDIAKIRKIGGLLSDSSIIVVKEAVHALSRSGESASVVSSEMALVLQHKRLRNLTLRTLKQIGLSPDAIEVVKAFCLSDEAELRASAVELLVEFELTDNDVVGTFVTIANDSSIETRTRCDAIKGLGQVEKATNQVLDCLFDLTDGRGKEVSQYAIEEFVGIGDSAFAYLLKIAKDKESNWSHSISLIAKYWGFKEEAKELLHEEVSAGVLGNRDKLDICEAVISKGHPHKLLAAEYLTLKAPEFDFDGKDDPLRQVTPDSFLFQAAKHSLNSEIVEVRRFAARCLAYRLSEEVVPDYERLVKNIDKMVNSTHQLGFSSAEAAHLVTLIIPPTDSEAAHALIEAIKDEDKEVRRNSLESLATFGIDKTIFTLLRIQEPGFRHQLLGKILERRLPHLSLAIKQILDTFQEDDENAKQRSESTLVSISQIFPSEDYFVDDDDSVKEITDALRIQLADESGIEVLIAELGSSHAAKLELIVKLLGLTRNVEAVAPLINELSSPRVHQSIVVDALGQVGRDAKEAIQVIIPLLYSEDQSTVVASVRALGRIQHFRNGIIDELIGTTQRIHSVKAETIRAIGFFRKEAVFALDFLIENLQSDDAEVRSSAALALARIGPKALPAISFLRRLSKDTDETVRKNADEAIKRIQLVPASSRI